MKDRDFLKELETAEYKPITFGLYNKIDDDMIPYRWGKQMNKVYGIDDFIYTQILLDKKEQFLLTMHNKKFLKNLSDLSKYYEGQTTVVDINFEKAEINIIKLKE